MSCTVISLTFRYNLDPCVTLTLFLLKITPIEGANFQVINETDLPTISCSPFMQVNNIQRPVSFERVIRDKEAAKSQIQVQ